MVLCFIYLIVWNWLMSVENLFSREDLFCNNYLNSGSKNVLDKIKINRVD